VLLPPRLLQLAQASPWLVIPIAVVLLGLLIGLLILGERAQRLLDRQREVLELRAELKQWQQAVLLWSAAHDRWEALHRMAAEQDQRLQRLEEGQEERAEPPPTYGPPFDEGELPAPERFVGRVDDLQWVLDRLTGRAASAAVGPVASIAAANGLAGIGKTALAAEAVRRLHEQGVFPDGIAVVVCVGLHDPAEVLRRVLGRFDPQRRQPQETNLATLGDRVQALLGWKRALVVLDNLEPELPVERVVAPLRTASIAILLTSRQVLPTSAVPQEASRMLELLTPDDAVDLFAEYAGRGTAQDLTREEQTLARRIAAALGYHTLAVKLAAAQATIQQRAWAALAEEYEQHPRRALVLRDGREAVQLVLDSSYAVLGTAAQQLLVGLALFASLDIGRRAALEGLGAGLGLTENEAEAALGEVLALRLVEAETNDQLLDEASDRERLRLHLLIRAFAEERVQETKEGWDEPTRQVVRQAIATYYADYLDIIPDQAKGADEENVVGALRDAHQSGQDETVADLCWGMAQFWRDRGRTRTALEYLPWGLEAADRVATQTGANDDRLRAGRLLSTYAQILQNMGRLAEAEPLHLRNLALRRELGDRRGEGIALSQLGELAQLRGQLEAAAGYFQQALEIDREVQDPQGEGVVLAYLGLIARDTEHDEDAERYFREALVILREVQDVPDTASILSTLGEFLVTRRGQPEEGCSMLMEAARLYDEMGLPEAEDTRELARQLGCFSPNEISASPPPTD
jgi:tetratricopeptide (TPR) repeat protein